MTSTIEELVAHLNLEPHPEGGWYSETYRSADALSVEGLPDRFPGQRSAATGIYFLITSENFSALHRIKSDEGWHFYAGTGMRIYDISPDGELTVHKLGPDLAAGEVYQSWVPAGHWFGSRVEVDNAWALVGCTVAPGFDFEDFELADREELMQMFPQHEGLIRELTR